MHISMGDAGGAATTSWWTTPSVRDAGPSVYAGGTVGGGSGTTNYKFIFSTGNFVGDASPDLLLVRRDGKLLMEVGDGQGGFSAPQEVGTNTSGWANYQQVFGPGDLNHDGKNDVLAINTDGQLVAYYGTGSGTFSNPSGGDPSYGTSGWAAYGSVFGVGDLSGDDDVNDDGVPDTGKADWLAISADGTLWRYDGTSSGGYDGRVQIGTSWGSFKSTFGVGDFSGDGEPDVMAIETNGTLRLYEGNDAGNFKIQSGGKIIGTSWQSYAHVFGPGDVDGDGKSDVLAIDTSGTMWLYSGNGAGDFIKSTGKVIGTSSWNQFKVVQTVGDWSTTGNVSRGNPDVLALNSLGDLYLYEGDGVENFTNPNGGTKIGWGWGSYNSVFGVGNFSGDSGSLDDALAIGSDGKLYLYAGNAGSTRYDGRVQVGTGTGWGDYQQVFGVGDLSGDAKPDVLAIQKDGTLRLFQGNGSGNFVIAAGTPIASGWAGYKWALGAGDVNRDGFPDVMAVGSGGSLLVFYGNGASGFSNAGGTVLAASGWDQFQSVFAAGDVNHDNYRDLWAVEKDGKLTLFLGNDTNTYRAASRKSVSSGW